jgi:chemotaxis protein CheX
VGTVGFLGDVSGLIYIYLEEAFAAQCTASLLGMTAEELSAAGAEAVNDAVGELTNMIVGVFKNGLCDQGFSCKLTIPSILRGSDFCVASTGASRRFIYSFAVSGRRVVADILLKTDES